jgi:hypothetical protein
MTRARIERASCCNKSKTAFWYGVQVRTTATGLVCPLIELEYSQVILGLRKKNADETMPDHDPSPNRIGLLLQAYNECMKCRCGPPPWVFLSLFELPYDESILLVRMGQKRIEQSHDLSLNWTGCLRNPTLTPHEVRVQTTATGLVLPVFKQG